MREDEMSTRTYWDKRAAQMEADMVQERECATSLDGQLKAAERRLAALLADKGAHTADEIAEAQAKVDQLRKETEAAKEAKFAAEWTLEVTKERRAAWNQRVKAGEFTGRGGKINWAALRKAEAEQGWTAEDLKRAIKLHQL